MQIISRSQNQGLVIGDDAVVTVLEIQTKFVRLGITTPKSEPFYREEILYYDDGDGDRVAETETTQPDSELMVRVTAL